MAVKREINGRVFYTDRDIQAAYHDKKRIDEICSKFDMTSLEQLKRIKTAMEAGTLRFHTVLGRDFEEDISNEINRLSQQSSVKNKKRISSSKVDLSTKNSHKDNDREHISTPEYLKKAQNANIDNQAKDIIRKKNKHRKWIMLALGLVASACIGIYFIFEYQNTLLDQTYNELADMKNEPDASSAPDKTVVIHYSDDDGNEQEIKLNVLDEYKKLYSENENLIGWIKIDDTIIDYPVLKCDDSDYYLSHNFYEQSDRNGSIFMDPKCEVVNRSDNIILYGHHMQSGRMFGSLPKYENKSFYEKHRFITFDTIYEKGTYEIAYVFRSHVFNEDDVVFKYYQFIDAGSDMEFHSNLSEMADMSLYDTGVTVRAGDELLTLSTCDYQEKNGRFVVVAKRIY